MQLPRLKQRKDFLKITQKGKRYVTDAFILQYLESPESFPTGSSIAAIKENNQPRPWRIGFTVTKKIGSAVVRNRVRRRLRSIADQVMMDYAQPGTDYVLIGRSEARSVVFAKMAADLKKALQSIHH